MTPFSSSQNLLFQPSFSSWLMATSSFFSCTDQNPSRHPYTSLSLAHHSQVTSKSQWTYFPNTARTQLCEHFSWPSLLIQATTIALVLPLSPVIDFQNRSQSDPFKLLLSSNLCFTQQKPNCLQWTRRPSRGLPPLTSLIYILLLPNLNSTTCALLSFLLLGLPSLLPPQGVVPTVYPLLPFLPPGVCVIHSLTFLMRSVLPNPLTN